MPRKKNQKKKEELPAKQAATPEEEEIKADDEVDGEVEEQTKA